MDTRIPMMVQSPDFAGSMMNGLNAGTAARDAQRQNALAQLYQQQGPQIMAGDPNALNALAQMDPGAAMGVQQNQLGMQNTRQGMAFDAEKMQMLRDQAKAAVAQQAAQVGADQLKAAAAETETMLRGAAPLYMAMQQGLPGAQEKLLGYLAQHGLPADPNNIDAIMYASQGALEGMKAYADLQPKHADPMAHVPSGYLPNTPGDLNAGVKPIPGYTPPSAATTIVNTGDNSGAFVKKGDEIAAQRMSDIVTTGQGAQQMLGDLGALAEVAKGLDTGLAAQLTAQLGPYADALGVPIDGLAPAQAYDAIVARMAPQMRTPGAGASSDFDAKQFLKSLPGLGKTPEGNAIISATLQAIQQHKIKAAELAGQALSGGITWQEADQKIAAMGNPFDAFNKFKGMGATGLSSADVTALSAVDIGRADMATLSAMTDDQISKLTPEQQLAAIARLKELNGAAK